jgi:hypothetical protein
MVPIRSENIFPQATHFNNFLFSAPSCFWN